jgi:hypothetical protein
MFGLTLPQVLGLSVVAAVVAAVGNLIALFVKDLFLARSFEKWKDRMSTEAVHRRYRDPLVLSAVELRSRIHEIRRTYPPPFLRKQVLATARSDFRSNTTTDPHFQFYKFVSSVYRLCAFLGWLELYRQDLTFLDSGKAAENRDVGQSVRAISGDMNDGRLNTAADWTEWRDHLIFREEQRAIGSAMIRQVAAQRSVMGYGDFVELFGSADERELPWWLATAANLLIDLEPSRDFRRNRLERLDEHLRELVGTLDPAKVANG